MEPLFAAIFQKVEDPALTEEALRKELKPFLEQLVPQLLQNETQTMQMRQGLDSLHTHISRRFPSLANLVNETANRILPPIPPLPKEMWGEVMARTKEPGRLSVDRATRQLSDAEKQKRVESGELDVRVFGCTSAKEAIQCIRERQLSRADLTEFKLSQEDVKQLIREFSNLKELILPSTQIPPDIGVLRNLKKLSCYGFWPEMGQLTQLEELSLTFVHSPPPEIGNLQSLKFLHLKSEFGRPLPPELGRLQNLKTVILEDPSPQPVVFQLKQLETLALNCNRLLPDIQNLTNLQVLKVSTSYNSSLKELPAEIGALQNLTQLNLHGAQIRTLPDSIGNLKNLTQLNLHGTAIHTLPNSIGNLKNLTDLDIEGTYVRKLPESMANLDQLKRLSLSFNPDPALLEGLKSLKQIQMFGRTFAPDALKAKREIVDPAIVIPLLQKEVSENALFSEIRYVLDGLLRFPNQRVKGFPLLFHQCAELKFSQEFQDNLRKLSDWLDVQRRE